MSHSASNPAWTWIAPVGAAAVVAGKAVGALDAGLVPVLVLAAGFLGAAVFASVHHAEVLAARIGEPLGSILLAVAVTVIEVALIVSIMLSGAPGGEMVARDTVFAAVMIVLNGIVGLCLVLGGRRHHEQSFTLEGTSASLAVLGTLAALALVLPNVTLSKPGPAYAPFQLVFVGAVSLLLYMVFLFTQTISHRRYFLEDEGPAGLPALPRAGVVAASAVLLLVALTGVVLLAKLLSAPLDAAVVAAGLPPGVVGVVIASVVLLPEGIAAVRAAVQNRLQASMNLALGSALASIGLTIPMVAAVSLATRQDLALGLSAQGMVMLVLTLFVSTLTLGTGRTTLLHGAIHLIIFGVFLLLAVVP
jgi:Ca2+:H+ antiporter